MTRTRFAGVGVAGRIGGIEGYEYGNTRLRARRGELLDERDYRELFHAGSPERLLGVLRSTAYGPDVEHALVHHDVLHRIDGSVRAHLVRSFGDMRRFYVGRPAGGVDLLLGRWDLRNLTAIVRSKARPTGLPELTSTLVPAGALDAAALGELSQQPSLRSVIELMVAWDLPSTATARRLLREWPEYERSGDPVVFEEALTQAWADSAADELGAWDGTELATAMRAELDQVNLLATLRRRAVDSAGSSDAGPVSDLRGGNLQPPVLRQIRRAASTAEVLELLRRQRLPGEWMAAIEWWTRDGDLGRLAGRLEREIAQRAIGSFVDGDPLGIAIPVAFVWAKECEARNVRLIGRAILHRFDWVEVEQEMFPWRGARSRG